MRKSGCLFLHDYPPGNLFCNCRGHTADSSLFLPCIWGCLYANYSVLVVGELCMIEKYYIVEYRLPITITEAKDPKHAAELAKDELEKELGIRLSNWNARVFEFDSEGDGAGPTGEYFFNPPGTTAREISKNLGEKHE